ncbi:response regulator [Methylopila sp. Yamaguchi]|uniref:response regulator n=1 Tax=Methylopila sp. Yamaguchi TaxID=1437817 RepID=UPI000CC74291|nr:response regulator [Methylopila sp. Yamaguchi]GBD48373.1 response regulator receiver protein [Methylopila sp. Yamaguchi]
MNMTVLVVEDEPLIRMAAVDMIQDAGLKVHSAANAAAAIALLERTPDVTLLFTDVHMPGTMDGIALAEVVHRRWPHVKLIVASAHHVVRNEDLPDDGRFIEKPYYPSVIRAAIKDVLTSPPSPVASRAELSFLDEN